MLTCVLMRVIISPQLPTSAFTLIDFDDCVLHAQDDEVEHVKTMAACQKLNNTVCSPHRRRTNARLHKEFQEDSSTDGHDNNLLGRLN